MNWQSWCAFVALFPLMAGCLAESSTEAPASAGAPSGDEELLVGPCVDWLGEPAPSGEGEDVVVLGAILPLSGALEEHGIAMRDGLALALADLAAVEGRRERVLLCDSAADPEIARSAARHLVDVAGVPAIVGPAISAATLEVLAEVTLPAGVLVVSPSATAPSLTEVGDHGLFWRTAASDALQASGAAAALRALDLDRVALASQSNTFAEALAATFRRQFCEGADPCDLVEASFEGADDVVEAMAEAAASGATGVYVAGWEPAAVDAAIEAGLTWVVVGDGIPLEEMPLADGGCVVQTLHAPPSGPVYERFRVRFVAETGQEPSSFAPHTYDAGVLVGLAQRRLARLEAPEGADLAAELQSLTSGSELALDGGEALSSALEARRPVTLVGASGVLAMDPEIGEPTPPVHARLWSGGGSRDLGTLWTGRPGEAAEALAGLVCD